MQAREVCDRCLTPDKEWLELAREGGYYVIRIGGVPLMSSAASDSEKAMASIAAELLGARSNVRVLVGGLGMGFTLRAALDVFGRDASITVAELLPALVGYSRGLLADLAARPLEDPRVRLHEGDVREPIAEGGWDAILMDIDNGPDALTAASNASFYGPSGLTRFRNALKPGGVLVVWSASPSAPFEARVRKAGMSCESRRVRARADVGKGGWHTLFVAQPMAAGEKRHSSAGRPSASDATTTRWRRPSRSPGK